MSQADIEAKLSDALKEQRVKLQEQEAANMKKMQTQLMSVER